MILPLFVGVFAALIGYSIGKSNEPKTVVRFPQPLPNAPPSPVVQGRRAPLSYVAILSQCVERRLPVSAGLVRAALIESHRRGDMTTFQAIATLFKRDDKASESDDKKSEESESPSEVPMVSPIEGVSDEDWKNFASKLRVREPSYATPSHLGAYEHNRQRLKSLGYGDELDENQQHEALASDIGDHYENARGLIDEFSGDATEIDGATVPITMSGILALLKAGGVQGAEQWLRDPDVRSRFPRTKELFLKANGCF